MSLPPASASKRSSPLKASRHADSAPSRNPFTILKPHRSRNPLSPIKASKVRTARLQSKIRDTAHARASGVLSTSKEAAKPSSTVAQNTETPTASSSRARSEVTMANYNRQGYRSQDVPQNMENRPQDPQTLPGYQNAQPVASQPQTLSPPVYYPAPAPALNPAFQRDVLAILQPVLDSLERKHIEVMQQIDDASVRSAQGLGERLATIEAGLRAVDERVARVENNHIKGLHKKLNATLDVAEGMTNALKKLDERVGTCDDGDARSLMTRLRAIEFQIGEMWERGRDSEANGVCLSFVFTQG